MTLDRHHEAREAARHDMLQDFVQRGLVPADEAADLRKPEGEVLDWTRPLATLARGIIITLLVAAAIIAIVAAWTFLRVDLVTLAPTAAEVMAADFDLERKLAGVMP